MFGFVAKHRGVWPVSWMCDAQGRVAERLLRVAVAIAERQGESR